MSLTLTGYNADANKKTNGPLHGGPGGFRAQQGVWCVQLHQICKMTRGHIFQIKEDIIFLDMSAKCLSKSYFLEVTRLQKMHLNCLGVGRLQLPSFEKVSHKKYQ
jgi:hypothetical protein